jgi:hypothetical protein
MPCLLISRDPHPRLLHDALALDVYSVVRPDRGRTVLASMLNKIVRQVYRLDLPVSGMEN